MIPRLLCWFVYGHSWMFQRDHGGNKTGGRKCIECGAKDGWR